MYFRRPGLSWSNSSPEGNRAGLRELAGRDPAPGLVAYRAERAIGWVSIAPREVYDRLAGARLLAPIDDRPVWSIVCFVVSRRARGSGVGSALLRAAIAYAAEHGATTVEAYPVADQRGRVAPASAYQGVESMFAKAGFKVAAVRRHNSASPPRPIMRLELT